MTVFRKEYTDEGEKSLEDSLLHDEHYPLVLELLGGGDYKGAGKLIKALKTKYSSPDVDLQELSWLEDMVSLTKKAIHEVIPDEVTLDLRCGPEQDGKRFTVNHSYYKLIEANSNNPFAMTELGKVILNAPSLTVATRDKGEEKDLSEYRKGQEALFFFEHALLLNPGYIEAHIARAEAFCMMDRMVESVECFSKAKKALDPLSENICLYARANKLQTKVAKLMIDQDEGLSAAESLEKARKLLAASVLSQSPDSRRAKNILFGLESQTLSQKESAELAYYNGIILKAEGSIERAVKYLKKAESLDPEVYSRCLSRPVRPDGLLSIISGSGNTCWGRKKADWTNEAQIKEAWSGMEQMSPEDKLEYAQKLLVSGLMNEEVKQERTHQALWVLYLLKNTEGCSDELQSEVAYYRSISQQLIGELGNAKDMLQECLALNPDHFLAKKRLTDIELEMLIENTKSEDFDVTYVMPSYNTSKIEARKAIDSILKRQVFDGSIELIYIDDGSTEGATADYIRSEYAEFVENGQLKVLKTVNQGRSAARNYGLKLFKEGNSQFCAFLDSDDIALPNRTQQSVDYLRQNHDINFIHGKADFIWATGEPKDSDADPMGIPDEDANDHISTHYWEEQWQRGNDIGLAVFRGFESPIMCPSVMIKRDAVEKAGYQNPAWVAGEDMVYWASVIRTGAKLGLVDQKIVQYRLKRE